MAELNSKQAEVNLLWGAELIPTDTSLDAHCWRSLDRLLALSLSTLCPLPSASHSRCDTLYHLFIYLVLHPLTCTALFGVKLANVL